MIFFINDESENLHLQNIDADLRMVLEELKNITKSKDSFFGLKTKENLIIQFLWEDKNKWLVDIPFDIKNGKCFQKYADLDNCKQITL